MTDSGFVVLDAADAHGYREWVRRWEAWPLREPMAHPAYALLMAGEGNRAVCLAQGDARGSVLYPLVVRPLGREPWAGPGEDGQDAVTPYGYGGAFSWGGRDDRVCESFWDAATRWFRGERIVSSFARLSLFPEEQLPFRGEVSEIMPNVVRSLRLDEDRLWRDYEHKVRKNVGAARRAGLRFEIDESGERLDSFLSVYHATMDRRDAAAGYFFPRGFFETLVARLAGSFFFAHVLHGGRVVSTELVLRSTRRLYSFLGGTLAEAFVLRPNDLLKHEVCRHGISAGMEDFVLGGGYGRRDGIFRYKLSFAPSGTVAFRGGRAVHDPERYGHLIERRRRYEHAPGREWEPRETFFPAYRS